MKKVTCCQVLNRPHNLCFRISFSCRLFHSLVRSCVLLIGWIVRFTELSDVFLLCFWEGDSGMCENVL
jgi:hypothetical protein